MTDEKAFAEAYGKLNTAQKQAVDAVEGPVLVIAGPGTGKTHILTLRIANILRKTQANATNILVLTFTESAARTVRRRLAELVGEVASRDVFIST
ncbi:MAG: UvrD/REP helicase, helicase / ATP-dependent helicase PcrA, partial [Parcubacteria group bacterium]|nr:UvrD/REP helicase, helicase / ATP-dependent helicase PcrA [Parcubacteria group bacterium]